MRSDEPGLERSPDHEEMAWYFGDLLGAVAREAPVSERRLVDGLVRLAESLSSARDVGDTAVPHRGSEETVLRISDHRWQTLANGAELSELEAAACREVHRRMAAALGVEPDTAVPVVVFDPPPSRE